MLAERGFYRTWMAHVSRILRLRRFAQAGIATSYPIFAYVDGGLHIRHFYFACDQIGPDTILIGPPQVLVTLDYPTVTVLAVNAVTFDLPPFDPVEYTLSADKRAARRSDIQHLEALYDQLITLYPDVPASELLDDLGAALQRAVPPALWPYYALLLRDTAVANR